MARRPEFLLRVLVGRTLAGISGSYGNTLTSDFHCPTFPGGPDRSVPAEWIIEIPANFDGITGAISPRSQNSRKCASPGEKSSRRHQDRPRLFPLRIFEDRRRPFRQHGRLENRTR